MQQRQCILLLGKRDWCEISTRQLLSNFAHEHILSLSDAPIADFPTLRVKQAHTQLGREFEAVVFDGLVMLLPDNIGQSVGTLKAGGVFIIWLSIDDMDLYSQRFRSVFEKFNSQYAAFHILREGDLLSKLTLPVFDHNGIDFRTADQLKTIEAIFKVVEGHRRRPLVLSADRGRGKSAAMGFAAAELMQGTDRKIIVTGPSLAAVEPVFRHALVLLKEAEHTVGLIQFGNAELRFVAPDALIEGHHRADLLLVDEAAVIPSPMLAEMLIQFSRIVFATTLHGYEGTGRGFSIRFQALLNENTPGWRHITMVEPIRWRADDTLEAFSFEALLLDAEPVDDKLVIEAELEDCSINLLDKQALFENEMQLRQLFGLMVLAHYRTRPSDLQLLLNSDDITLYVAQYRGHIVGCVWLVDEGPLESELANAVYQGERRLKGHLLPQSLLAHSGFFAAGNLRYQRILRIAIHPALQRRGLATALIQKVSEVGESQQFDVLGTSFAADLDVMSFWREVGFEVVRLGVKRDEVSGQHSVTLLRPFSALGTELVKSVRARFHQQWADLLTMQFSLLDVKTVLAISTQFSTQNYELSTLDKQDLLRFSRGMATYESCQIAIRNFVVSMLSQAGFLRLPIQHQQLLVMRVLQLKPIAAVAKDLSFKGKSDLTLALRQALVELSVEFAAEDEAVITLE